MVKRRLSLLVATFVLAAFALVLPVSGGLPEDKQATASAAPIRFVYNVGWSTNSLQVFQKPNGKGKSQKVKPGRKSTSYVGFPDSYALYDGCRIIFDPQRGPGLDTAFNYSGRPKPKGTKRYPPMIKNFPKHFFGQKVIAEVYCT